MDYRIIQRDFNHASLKTAPDVVTGDMYLFNCAPIFLENFPREIHGTLFLNKVSMFDFTEIKTKISGNIEIVSCQLDSLRGLPQIGGSLRIMDTRFGRKNPLQGCPEVVNGDFMVGNCDIKSLEFMPLQISGNCIVSHNKVTNLEFGPESVGGDFNCANNSITSVNSRMRIGGNFYAAYNRIRSLDGMPQEIGHSIDLGYNNLTDLVGIPPDVKGNLYLRNNENLTDISALHKVGGCLELIGTAVDCSKFIPEVGEHILVESSSSADPKIFAFNKFI